MTKRNVKTGKFERIKQSGAMTVAAVCATVAALVGAAGITEWNGRLVRMQAALAQARVALSRLEKQRDTWSDEHAKLAETKAQLQYADKLYTRAQGAITVGLSDLPQAVELLRFECGNDQLLRHDRRKVAEGLMRVDHARAALDGENLGLWQAPVCGNAPRSAGNRPTKHPAAPDGH